MPLKKIMQTTKTAEAANNHVNLLFKQETRKRRHKALAWFQTPCTVKNPTYQYPKCDHGVGIETHLSKEHGACGGRAFGGGGNTVVLWSGV